MASTDLLMGLNEGLRERIIKVTVGLGFTIGVIIRSLVKMEKTGE